MASDTSLVFNILGRDRVSKVLGAIGGAFRSTASQAEEALDKASTDTAKLDAELERVESSLRDLNREFAETGNKELFAKMKRDRTLLANLRKIRQELDDIGDEADDAGDKMANNLAGRFAARWKAIDLSDGVNGAFRSLPIEAKGAVIGAAAVIGGIFVSALAAGILLGLGGGVLALGIKSALADPKVTAAWSTFGERAKKATAGFTNAFKGPVARAAGTFGAAIERMGPAFTRIGQTIAPVIDKLAPALADMAERAMPGIEKAITASVPLFLKLAEKLPALGDSITSFFDSVSAAAPAALLVLGVLMDLIGGVIRYWGNGIEFWSKTLVSFKDAMVAAKNWIVGVWNSVVGFVSGLPGRISKAASGMWNGIKNSFRSAVNWIIARWNSLSFTVGGGSIMGVGIPSITLNTPDIPMLAKGGIATTPGLAVVGERGPELVSLTKGAQVTPLPARGRGPARGELELVGEREVVAFVRRLIKQYRLVEG